MGAPKELLDRMAQANWIWAKTYAEFAPHWYIIKENDPKLWDDIAVLIDKYGVVSEFRKTNTFNRYLVIGDYKYWHYDIILNRAKKDDD